MKHGCLWHLLKQVFPGRYSLRLAARGMKATGRHALSVRACGRRQQPSSPLLAVIGDRATPPREDPRRWLPMRGAIEAPQQQTGTIELAIPDLEQAMVTGKLRHMRRALSRKYKLTRNGERCVMHNAFQPIRGLTMFQLSSPGKLLIATVFAGVLSATVANANTIAIDPRIARSLITTSSQSRPLPPLLAWSTRVGLASAPPACSLTHATGFAFSGNPAEEAELLTNL